MTQQLAARKQTNQIAAVCGTSIDKTDSILQEYALYRSLLRPLGRCLCGPF